MADQAQAVVSVVAVCTCKSAHLHRCTACGRMFACCSPECVSLRDCTCMGSCRWFAYSLDEGDR